MLPQVNMSIYLNECIMKKIKDKYFSHNPFLNMNIINVFIELR